MPSPNSFKNRICRSRGIKLAAAAMSANSPFPDADTTRNDLIAMLMIALHGSDIPKMHRRVKTFVFSLHVDALNELSGVTRRSGECFKLNANELENLLDRALGFGGVAVYQEDGCGSEIQDEIDSVSSEIASIDVTKGLNEICGEKARKKLRKARQMINRHCFTMTFVVMDDVIAMVKAEGVTDKAAADRRAQRIWESVCFTLEIYYTAQGEEGTLAEFMCAWLQAGYSWQASFAHLRTLFPTSRKRALPPETRSVAMKRLRADAAHTYDPQPLAGTEAGGDLS